MSSVSTRQMQRLLRIIARLRGPRGCPWDRQQTHRSIRHNLIEEAYEAVDALERGRLREFQEELGDLLMQIVFHAQVAAEAGRFTFDDVARGIADKLVRRHPHVFGRRKLATSQQVLQQWETIKKQERQTNSIIGHIPHHLPALLKADKIQRKVARVGFDWQHVHEVVAKIEEELQELKRALATGQRRAFADELGDLLFATVNLARFEGLQAEELLNRTIRKFIRRFQQMERVVQRRGRQIHECSPAELDVLWEAAKRTQRSRRARAARSVTRGK